LAAVALSLARRELAEAGQELVACGAAARVLRQKLHARELGDARGVQLQLGHDSRIAQVLSNFADEGGAMPLAALEPSCRQGRPFSLKLAPERVAGLG
jgi:hypothetical protein